MPPKKRRSSGGGQAGAPAHRRRVPTTVYSPEMTRGSSGRTARAAGRGKAAPRAAPANEVRSCALRLCLSRPYCRSARSSRHAVRRCGAPRCVADRTNPLQPSARGGVRYGRLARRKVRRALGRVSFALAGSADAAACDSREKLKPTAELQQARRRIHDAKVRDTRLAHARVRLATWLSRISTDARDVTDRPHALQLRIRECMRVIDESGGDAAIPVEHFDEEGECDEEHVRHACRRLRAACFEM